MPFPVSASPAYYLPQGAFIALQVQPMVAVTLGAKFKVVYEDGDEEVLTIGETAFTAGTTQYATSDTAAKKEGTVVHGFVYTQGAVPPVNSVYVRLFLVSSRDPGGQGGASILGVIGEGYCSGFTSPSVGVFELYDGRRYASAEMLVTYTQTGAGNFTLDVMNGASSRFEVIQAYAVYTGTNALQIRPLTASATAIGSATWIDIASVASAVAALPKNDTTPTTTGGHITSQAVEVLPSNGLRFTATAAGGGADAIVVYCTIRVSGFLPTVTAGGAGTWGVTAGAASFTVR